MEVLGDEELRAAHMLFGATIHTGPRDDEAWAVSRRTYAPGRTLGMRDGTALVATATSFPARTAVPGGAVLPMAAVTRVGVRADRTRRGLLTALMGAQLADVAHRGEPLASLRASEARIYGRFGYGVATRGRDVRVRLGPAGWRDPAPGTGTVRLLERDEVLDVLAAVHDTIALGRPGGMTRPAGWFDIAVGGALRGREPLLAAVHTGPGGDDGFAVATPEDPPGGQGFRMDLRVRDLHAAGPAAAAALWRFLLGVDLVDAVVAANRPLDEPLDLLLADPRDCAVTGVEDETWLRLVDVPAALAARAFPVDPAAAGGPAPVLLAVHDPLLPANAGVYRLGGGTAERVGPLGGPVRPHLECDAAGLATAYLGDRAPTALAGAGWWRVHDPAALTRADALFATPAPPWCGTSF